MFEAIEFVDYKSRPTAPPVERLIGEFENEADAVEAARQAREAFDQPDDYAWWVVRQSGARLSRWIADSRSDKEYVLDLTSGELVEVQ